MSRDDAQTDAAQASAQDAPRETAAPQPRRGFLARMAAVRPSDLVVLIFLCVLAGLVLAAFNVDPAELWVDFFGAAAEAWGRFFQIIGDSLAWGVQYFLLGAVLVVPIWIAWRVLKALSGRR